jgi:ribosomal protein S14
MKHNNLSKNKRIVADNHRRQIFKKTEHSVLALLLMTDCNAINYKPTIHLSFLSMVANRCLITGRGKIQHRKFQLSRQALRSCIASGDITGIRRAI